MAVVYSNDFDSETTGTIATSFANKTGTWQVTTGTPVSGAKSFGSNTNADGDVVLLTGVSAVADMQWDSKQKVSVPGSSFPLIGHVLRSDSANANHYVVLFSSMTSTGGNILIFKKVGGSYSSLSTTGVTLAQANGDTIYVRTKIVGSTISVYVGNGSLPGSPSATLTDSSISAAGYAGFYNGKDGVSLSMTIDDVSLDDLTAGGTTIAVPLGTLSLTGFAPSLPVGGNQTIAVPAGSLTLTGRVPTIPTASATKAPDSAGIVYSPYNWLTGSTSAKTINPGAYFKTLFTGATCTLNFDTSNLTSPNPRLLIRVDRRTWQAATVASTVSVTMPTDQDNTTHLLEVLVDAATETVNRWNSPQNTAVVMTGITLASAGDSLSAPQSKPKRLLVYGDSITEGVRTLKLNGAVNDLDRNSAVVGWALELGNYLDAEVGVVGFGATGLSTSGSGNVPKLSGSYNLLWASQSRSFSTSPDYCVWLEGANDSTTNTQADGIAALNGMLSAMSGTKFILFRPLLNTNQEANLQAIQAGCSDPSRVTYVSTSGYWSTADSSDSLHPYGYTNIASIAPKMAAAVLLAAGSGGTVNGALSSARMRGVIQG